MDYLGRPGITPALAMLIAEGRLTRRQTILDVGCGTGTDVLLLASWGFRHVEGVDPDAWAIGIARRRASRRRLSSRAAFHVLGAEALGEQFAAASVDVVLHTLVANNLTKDHERHFKEVARVLKPSGLLVLTERMSASLDNAAPGKVDPPNGLARVFTLTPSVSFQIAEHDAGGRRMPYARVALWLGRPKRR